MNHRWDGRVAEVLRNAREAPLGAVAPFWVRGDEGSLRGTDRVSRQLQAAPPQS